MKQIKYSPEARQDLRNVKKYIKEEWNEEIAQKVMVYLMSQIRLLERHPELGVNISDRFSVVSDYKYLVLKKNYVFYRLEDKYVRVIRILSDMQDFMQILFGIQTQSDEVEDYWID